MRIQIIIDDLTRDELAEVATVWQEGIQVTSPQAERFRVTIPWTDQRHEPLEFTARRLETLERFLKNTPEAQPK